MLIYPDSEFGGINVSIRHGPKLMYSKKAPVSYNQHPSPKSIKVTAKTGSIYTFMPTGKRRATDTSLLEAALIGFEQMKRNVEEKIAGIRSQLSGGGSASSSAPAQTGRRPLSTAARRRIAAAQRKRWAALKAKAPAKAGKAKRTMSAAARKKIAAAQRKRWALVKANKTAKAAG
jgi:hypothetical protein